MNGTGFFWGMKERVSRRGTEALAPSFLPGLLWWFEKVTGGPPAPRVLSREDRVTRLRMGHPLGKFLLPVEVQLQVLSEVGVRFGSKVSLQDGSAFVGVHQH